VASSVRETAIKKVLLLMAGLFTPPPLLLMALMALPLREEFFGGFPKNGIF